MHRYRDVVCTSVMFVCPYPAAELPVPVPSSWPALASASVAFKGGPCKYGDIVLFFLTQKDYVVDCMMLAHSSA